MNIDFKKIFLLFFLFSCAKLDSKKSLDPSSPIGFLIQRDLCGVINICPPEFFRARELNSFVITNPPSIGIFKNDTVNFVSPFRTDFKKLKSRFSFRGNFVQVNSAKQESGVTENDFTEILNYSVVSFDKKESIYKIRSNRAPINAKSIEAYRFIEPNVSGFILGSEISIYVPFGTNLSALVAEIFTTGDSLNINAILQENGVTPNNFSTPKTYTVVAFDGSTQDYTVTAFSTSTSSNEMKFFKIDSIGVIGTITGSDINITVPVGTNLNNLAPSFSHDGNKVQVGNIDQVSGLNSHNFSNPVVYSVIAQNGSVRNYTVRITVASISANEITSFLFFNPSATGVINQTNSTITINVPAATNRRNLVAHFTTTGTSVNINGTDQTTGVTIVNFQAAVIYSVVASDGKIKNYTVTVNLL